MDTDTKERKKLSSFFGASTLGAIGAECPEHQYPWLPFRNELRLSKSEVTYLGMYMKLV